MAASRIVSVAMVTCHVLCVFIVSRHGVVVHRVPWPTLKGTCRGDRRDIAAEGNDRIVAEWQQNLVSALLNQATHYLLFVMELATRCAGSPSFGVLHGRPNS